MPHLSIFYMRQNIQNLKITLNSTLSREIQIVNTFKQTIKKYFQRHSPKMFSNSFQNIFFLRKTNSSLFFRKKIVYEID